MTRTSLLPPPLTRLHLENRIRYWWQSRMVKNGTIPDPPELIDIPAFAQSIRRTWSRQ